jgi:hypothetical protein
MATRRLEPRQCRADDDQADLVLGLLGYQFFWIVGFYGSRLMEWKSTQELGSCRVLLGWCIIMR